MAFFGLAGVTLLVLAALPYGVSGGHGYVWFLPADALAALMAVSGLLALAAGAVVSVWRDGSRSSRGRSTW